MSSSQSVARVYAEALLDLVADNDTQLSRLVDDLHGVDELFAKDATFREFFGSPRLDPVHKKRVLDMALKDKLDRPALGLLHVLIDKQREMLLDNIVQEFDRFRDVREGRLHAYVTTARELGDDQRGQLVAKLEAATGKKIQLHEKVEPRVLGGIRVKVGDNVIDGTVRRRLHDLRGALVSKG